MLSIFELLALLLTLSALFGWLNRRFIRLPHSVGLLVVGLFASLLLALTGAAFPGAHLYVSITRAMEQIDFTAVVMNGMLAFLLFAGALNLDLNALRDRAGPVVVLAVVATLISTVLVGTGFWAIAQALGQPISLPWALVFGALISPTDPVAVLTVLKSVALPRALETELQGEALFNDGVGVVLFTLFVGYATGSTGPHASPATDIALHVLRQAGGGLVLGIATGYLAYRAMRAIDDFAVETLITLALVAGTYALAQRLDMSGPLSVVAAGLLVGFRAPQDAMTDNTKRYITTLWTLIDEVLNSILFLLIALEVLIVSFPASGLVLALLSIPLVLLARLIAVAAPLAFPWSGRLSARNVPFLTWAGVRGGISVALALALPAGEARPVILAATYTVVLFTLIVQGSSVGWVARRTLGISRPPPEERT